MLTVPRVNPGIWNDLPRASKKLDVGLQEAQKSAVHAAQAITLAVESLIRCKKEKAELDQKLLPTTRRTWRTKRKCKLRQLFI